MVDFVFNKSVRKNIWIIILWIRRLPKFAFAWHVWIKGVIFSVVINLYFSFSVAFLLLRTISLLWWSVSNIIWYYTLSLNSVRRFWGFLNWSIILCCLQYNGYGFRALNIRIIVIIKVQNGEVKSGNCFVGFFSGTRRKNFLRLPKFIE